MGNFNVLFREFETVMGMGLLQLLITEIPGMLINLAVYIFTGLGLYTIASHRGIRNPWLAWVPLANLWLLGCISDHYQSLANGKTTKRRAVLLVSRIAILVVAIIAVAICLVLLVEIFTLGFENLETLDAGMLLADLMRPVLAMALLSLLLIPVAIIHLVYYFIALHDVYKSCDPANATLYLVLSIFISVCIPIFLMICRDKNGGMPVRQPQPAHNELPDQEPWEGEEE